MTARGFRNIFWVSVVVFIFAFVQVFLFQRICNSGMTAAKNLEYQGLPNLNQLADLREQLVLFRLYSFEYLFSKEGQRLALKQSVQLTSQRIYTELEQIKKLHHSAQGQHLATDLDQSVKDLSQAFNQMTRLTDQDFAGAMIFLDHDLPPKIQAVNDAADALNQFGYQLSGAQAKANFDSFDDIKSQAYFLGLANIAAALGLVVFILLAAQKTRQQLAHALAQIQEQARKLSLQSAALNAVSNAIVITDAVGNIEWANPAFSRLTGYVLEEEVSRNTRILKADEQSPEFHANMRRITEAFNRNTMQTECWFQRRDGVVFPAAITLTPFQQGDKRLFQATICDLTEIKQAEKERQLMEVQLRQSQKLESIGQLAAGIAHEINTPTQYIGDNTRFLKDAFGSMVEVLRNYDQLLAAAKSAPLSPGLIAQVETAMASRDMEFLYSQIPSAILETLEGVERVSKIVRAMKEFSHPGGKEKTPSNLNKAIETTTTVARNEWKYVADLELRLAPNLPPVPCFLGEFNQAVLNLIVNAAHAVGDAVRAHPGNKGKITVSTERLGEQVEIRVSDTGTGIEEKHRAKIFEPFFTTKGIGKGTGQGLTVVYSIIVKKHGGTVTFETEVGRGSTFIIRLPLNPPP